MEKQERVLLKNHAEKEMGAGASQRTTGQDHNAVIGQPVVT
jgi:hypothetical protein